MGGWLRRADAEADKGARLLYLTPDGEDVSVLGAECKRGGKPARRLQANRRSEIRVGRFARLLGGEAIGVVDRYTSAATASVFGLRRTSPSDSAATASGSACNGGHARNRCLGSHLHPQVATSIVAR